ncbi:hypothetical protein RN001_008202 [Aquatica leii]|uniref:Sodium/potassium-transporting ATPase subunit beta-2 n=1 Tax=Aquatica leii TaxID=1421715 RepID=A0AAN7PEV3_9COLE|nr:hypothetical protein RN001_008202 [Aquatica leii]
MALCLIEVASECIKKNCVGIPCVKKQDILFQASPGLSFEPNIIRSQSPLLWFGRKKAEKPTEYYVNYITKFLQKYNESTNTDKYSNCSLAKESFKPCPFYFEDLGPCGISSYGYNENLPCIYLKLNKLPEWKPEYYADDNLPYHMPAHLKTVIEEAENKNILWLHCEGMTPSDVEHLGFISYHPTQGYKDHYFLSNYEHYIAPIVAVKLNHVERGYSISISCSIWAKNVNNKDPKEYTTYIQLYMDYNDD